TDEELQRIRSAAWSGSGLRAGEKRILTAWGGLYDGTLVADDIRDLARDLFKSRTALGVRLLGDHEPLNRTSPEAGTDATGGLTAYIRRPFWAFSNVVAPARIEQGRLVAATTGGTSMSCVLAHVARTRPRAAIVVTDGYIEPLTPAQVAATAGTRLHVIVTRDGNAALLRRAGLAYTQLSRLPS